MICRLERHTYSPIATLGRLYVDGSVFHTVERPWLGNKPFESCIPEGVYTVKPYSSPKYPNHFELVAVPGRSKILIHEANFPSNVQGCIGLGMTLMTTAYGVKHSRDAMVLFRQLVSGFNEFDIEITQYRPEYP